MNTMKYIDQFDLRRRRSTGGAPVQAEILAVLEALEAEGVAPPAEAVRAMELLDGAKQLHVLPDVETWIAGADLDSLDPAQIREHLRADLADLGLQVGASGPNLFGRVHAALVARAARALAADLERILEDLRSRWAVAAEVVHYAARTGIGSSTTAAQVIELGDEAIAAYRQLAGPLASLDRLWNLRTTLLFYAGRELAERDLGQQRWLDRAAAAPPELTSSEVTWQQRNAQHMLAAATPDETTTPDTDPADTVDTADQEIDIETEHREEITA